MYADGDLWAFFVGPGDAREWERNVPEETTGRTPFIVAAERGLLDVVRWYKSPPNLKDRLQFPYKTRLCSSLSKGASSLRPKAGWWMSSAGTNPRQI